MDGKIDFSFSKFTERHNNKEFFKSSTIYTLQMVVNSQTEFLGFNEAEISNTISTFNVYFTTIGFILNIATIRNKILQNITIKNQVENIYFIGALNAKTAITSIKRAANAKKNLINTNLS